MNIGKSIEICLEDRGMMKKKLAEKLDVTPQTVTTLIQSKECTGPMLRKLSEIFEMKSSQFIAIGEQQ